MPQLFYKTDKMTANKHFEDEKIDLMAYWLIVWKRKWLVILAVIVTMAVAAYRIFSLVPIFTAHGTLLIEKEANFLQMGEEGARGESTQEMFIRNQTQSTLLKSYTLAERAVEKLKLAEKFARKMNSLPGKTGAAPIDALDPGLKRGLTESLMNGISVTMIEQTRLIEVSYRHPDPEMAAATVNALFEAAIDMSVESKYEATEQASEFLSGQIRAYRQDIEAALQKLQSYGAEKNIISLSDRETTTIEKLGALNRALTDATIQRINKAAYFNEVKGASAEFIATPLGNPLIDQLRVTYAELKRDFQKKSEIYGSEYPEMLQLKSELETTRLALESETRNVIHAANSEFQAALKRENSLSAVFNDQKKEAELFNSNAIAYFSLKNDIDNKKNILNMLMRRESETGVSARLQGLRLSNLKIVDRARVPISPSGPDKKKILLQALFMGLFMGAGIAFLLNYFDKSVKTSNDVQDVTELPTLGLIPEFTVSSYRNGFGYGQLGRMKKKEPAALMEKRHPGNDEFFSAARPRAQASNKTKPPASIRLITHLEPTSSFSENYRTMRTAFLLSPAGLNHNTIVFSSSLPQEGKSTTLSNFAVTLAQDKKRVLIIDADFRRPQQHLIFGQKNASGLSDFLSTGLDLKNLIKPTTVANCYLIKAGSPPENPSELLGSKLMAQLLDGLKSRFDYILLDTPPILAVADAMVIAPRTDGLILIVWGGKTPRTALRLAKEKLMLMNIKPLGVVINNLNFSDRSFFYTRYNSYAAQENEGVRL